VRVAAARRALFPGVVIRGERLMERALNYFKERQRRQPEGPARYFNICALAVL
jgi:hypothetical protein